MKRFIVVTSLPMCDGGSYPAWREFSQAALEETFPQLDVTGMQVGEFVIVPNRDELVFRHADGEAEVDYFHDR